MKLTQIQTVHLPDYANYEFVRLQTNEGLVGYGETTYAPAAVRGFITYYEDLVTTNVTVEDGHILAPQGPGLGTALQPDLAERPGAISVVSPA